MFDIGKLDAKTMAAYRNASLSVPRPKPSPANMKAPGVVSAELLRAFALFDSLTRFVMPLVSAVPGRVDGDMPVTKTIMLADIAGLNMRQLWNLKGYIQDFNKLLAINYPEILDRVLVCSPMFIKMHQHDSVSQITKIVTD